MHSLRILCGFVLAAASPLAAQTLTMVSGNGQVVYEQFFTTSPFVVQVRTATGEPVPGVPVSWAITQGQGSLRSTVNVTDAEGRASTVFLATSLQPGTSFAPATITATSARGNASFVVTTAALRNPGGGLGILPLVEMLTPPQENRRISGRAGATVPGALILRIISQSGFQSGQPVANVGVRIINVNDDPSTSPSGACIGQGTTLLSDSTGTIRCDLALNSIAGTSRIAAIAGEYQQTPSILLEVEPGAPCTYSLSSATANVPAAGGSATVSVTAPSGCGWTATTAEPWLSVTSGASGSGNGTATISATALASGSRSGVVVVAGQNFTINQSLTAPPPPPPLTITTSALAGANVGVIYSSALSASGGIAPYNWSITTGQLPPGLSLNASTGIISGTPTTAGTFPITATVRDTPGTSVSRAFTITVITGGSNTLTITTASFASGQVGQPYQQALTSSGGCVSPFSPAPAFSLVSGTLPPGLTLRLIADRTWGIAGTPESTGTFSFMVRVTDSCNATATASFTITIGTGQQTNFTATPASLTFSAEQGSAVSPPDQTVQVRGAPGSYTAAATQGTTWLSVVSGAAVVGSEGTVVVRVANTAALAPATYEGEITISAPTAQPIRIRVTVTVAPAIRLTANPASITFQQTATSGVSTALRDVFVTTDTLGARYLVSASTNGGGTWLQVRQDSPIAPSSIAVIVSSGGLAVGTYTGTVRLQPVGGTSSTSIPVTLTVTPPPSLIPNPLNLLFTAAGGSRDVNVASSGGALGFTVTVTPSAPWLTVTPLRGTTPETLRVVVNAQGLQPGLYTANIGLILSDVPSPPVNIPVALTVDPSAPTLGAVTSAATFQPGAIAPGEYVTLFGTNIGPAQAAFLRLTPDGAVDSLLAETRVTFDGLPAPLLYTSAGQINAIVPYAVAGRVLSRVVVEFRGVPSNALEVPVAEAAPAIFVQDSTGQGAIANQDGSVNSAANPAQSGSVISIFGTGEGLSAPSGPDGRIISPAQLPRPLLPVDVLINGERAEVQYAGGTPGFAAGLFQVNARIGQNAPRGTSVEIRVVVGGVSSQPNVRLAIAP